MKRLAIRFALAGVALAAVGIIGASAPAGATPVGGSLDSSGWWTSRPAAPMDGGGFEIALGADGNPQSVAAIRVTVDTAHLSKLAVSLAESASVGSQFSHLRICRAAPGWAPANPGALADAPKMDCSAPFVDLVHRTGAWDGDLLKMIPEGGTASLGIVGVRDQQAPVNLLVDITGVTIGGEGTLVAPSTETTETTAPPTTTFDSSPGAPSFGVADPSFASGSFDPPAAFAPTVVAPTVTTIAPSVSGPTRFAASVQGRPGPSRPWLRLVLFAPLSAAIGIGLVYLRRFLSARGANFS